MEIGHELFGVFLYLLRGFADHFARLTINHFRSVVEDQVDQQWASIFGQKYGLPSDLWAQVFAVDLATVAHVKGVQFVGVFEGFSAHFQSKRLAVGI
jgi:hypothetical protein